MISFKIEHPDFPEEPIEHSLYFDTFLVGSNNRCQLRFPDHINAIYLKATQTKDHFMIESLEDYSFILNGTKYRGKLNCKKGDILKLGMATITITDVDLSIIHHKIDFSKKSAQLLSEFSHMNKVISTLEKELLYSDDHS